MFSVKVERLGVKARLNDFNSGPTFFIRATNVDPECCANV